MLEAIGSSLKKARHYKKPLANKDYLGPGPRTRAPPVPRRGCPTPCRTHFSHVLLIYLWTGSKYITYITKIHTVFIINGELALKKKWKFNEKIKSNTIKFERLTMAEKFFIQYKELVTSLQVQIKRKWYLIIRRTSSIRQRPTLKLQRVFEVAMAMQTFYEVFVCQLL